MKLFGVYVTGKHIDEPVKLDEISSPLFHKGGKTGCVCMHGIGGTPATVRVVADELIRRGYSVAVPFLAGHGTTVRDFSKCDEEDWIRSAMEACDRLKAEGCTDVVPIGLSLGGVVAGQLAARREDCSGAVLICAPLKMKPFLRLSKALSLIMPYIWYGPQDHHDPAFWEYSRMINGISTRSLIYLDRMSHDLKRRLKDVKCPVFAVWAKYDNKVDERSKEILKQGLRPEIPYREVLMENSPHGCTYSGERDKVAAIVADAVDNMVRTKGASV